MFPYPHSICGSFQLEFSAHLIEQCGIYYDDDGTERRICTRHG